MSEYDTVRIVGEIAELTIVVFISWLTQIGIWITLVVGLVHFW